MTHTHATRFVVAVVLLATVVAAGSVVPTASHVSDSESIEGNHMGTADAWGIDLAVEAGEPDLLMADDSTDSLEITATVTNDHRYTEDVDVSLEVGTESETEVMTLEGGESDSVTFVLEADELDEGDLEYVVTAAEEEVHGQLTVSGSEEDEDNDTESNGDDNNTTAGNEESGDNDLEGDDGDDGDGDESDSEDESESGDEGEETSKDDEETDGGDSDAEYGDEGNGEENPDSETADGPEDNEADDDGSDGDEI